MPRSTPLRLFCLPVCHTRGFFFSDFFPGYMGTSPSAPQPSVSPNTAQRRPATAFTSAAERHAAKCFLALEKKVPGRGLARQNKAPPKVLGLALEYGMPRQREPNRPHSSRDWVT